MAEAKWRLLIVDDEPSNLKQMNQILGEKYQLAFANNGVKALDAVRKTRPDLVLLDILMPKMGGYEVCRRLKADPATAKIPVIFVTAMGDVENESLGFEMGGVDYITKPVSGPIVQARVSTHLSLFRQQQTCEIIIQQRTSELEAIQKSAIHMLGQAGDYNDTDTGVHIWRMAAYSAAIARSAGWKAENAGMLELAALMHDTGKIGIPDAILKKPAKLDADEWKIMKSHTLIGHSILSKSNAPLLCMAAEVALYHHEKWDGFGYPKGLAGKNIPESARIVAIADVFDALTMKRPYKEQWTVEKAFAEIQKCSGSHFDPYLTDKFFSIETEIRNLKEIWDNKENQN
ncbi:MAG: response regulator [Desulfobacterales bacterium]|nr:response regulator [Desulfobacterales bacterium]